jgi:hypothetical protein
VQSFCRKVAKAFAVNCTLLKSCKRFAGNLKVDSEESEEIVREMKRFT